MAVIVPTKNKKDVYKYLFRQGCLVVKKESAHKHPEIAGVPNLHVRMLMKSLCSRELVREQFNWQYFYYFLTDEGVEYLRAFLHLDPDVCPDTHKQKAINRPDRRSRGPRERGSRGPRREWGNKMSE
eukprot:gnl/Carplike_NY0171/67_a89_9343.p2 GENE.gnl/Carplike_NY0171/67_a89_9343~~gnl/Carplike_NY0171/67_a89_9343.p2  ORF type:complete len:127 (-),score=39.70 gnl/Carplike_NY0171/67_a89_9343:47-427(-)